MRGQARRTLPRGGPDHSRDRRRHRLLPAAGHLAGRDRRDVRPLRAGVEAAAGNGVILTGCRAGRGSTTLARSDLHPAVNYGPTSAPRLSLRGRKRNDRRRHARRACRTGCRRGAARSSFAKVMDEFAWRLAAGIGLLAVSITPRRCIRNSSARPINGGGIGQTARSDGQARGHRPRALSDNPVRRARNGGKTIRRAGSNPASAGLFRAARTQGARRHRISCVAGREPVRLRGA